MAKKLSKKSPQRLDAEIASSLSAQGRPELAALFGDPSARRTFARELRHEIQRQQTSAITAAARAARPYTVKQPEAGGGRSLEGNYASLTEARARADAVSGWVEHGGRVVYGEPPTSHAVRKARALRRVAYRITLTPEELQAVAFARGRYAWPDMLSMHAAEDGTIAFTENEMTHWIDDVDSDPGVFPLASGAFAEKLQRFYDSRI